jgi:hypothetical protein
MTNLTWTKNLPAEPGHYWNRIFYKKEIIWVGIVEVFLLNKSLYSDTGNIINKIGPDRYEEWAGPIIPPKQWKH